MIVAIVERQCLLVNADHVSPVIIIELYEHLQSVFFSPFLRLKTKVESLIDRDLDWVVTHLLCLVNLAAILLTIDNYLQMKGSVNKSVGIQKLVSDLFDTISETIFVFLNRP